MFLFIQKIYFRNYLVAFLHMIAWKLIYLVVVMMWWAWDGCQDANNKNIHTNSFSMLLYASALRLFMFYEFVCPRRCSWGWMVFSRWLGCVEVEVVLMNSVAFIPFCDFVYGFEGPNGVADHIYIWMGMT